MKNIYIYIYLNFKSTPSGSLHTSDGIHKVDVKRGATKGREDVLKPSNTGDQVAGGFGSTQVVIVIVINLLIKNLIQLLYDLFSFLNHLFLRNLDCS